MVVFVVAVDVFFGVDVVATAGGVSFLVCEIVFGGVDFGVGVGFVIVFVSGNVVSTRFVEVTLAMTGVSVGSDVGSVAVPPPVADEDGVTDCADAVAEFEVLVV